MTEYGEPPELCLGKTGGPDHFTGEPMVESPVTGVSSTLGRSRPTLGPGSPHRLDTVTTSRNHENEKTFYEKKKN